MTDASRTYTVFAGERRLVRAPLEEMLRKTKKKLDAQPDLRVFIFDDETGREVDYDFRGTADEVVARAVRENEAPRTGPGRPKLGVVAREVTLLPRHWEWLERQPNGASAALRRLVDDARKKAPDAEKARAARAAASRFMWVMAGDLPNFEEASRALFAADRARFQTLVKAWPADIKKHLDELLREGGAIEPG
jgi:hypothetical protein